MSHNMYVVKIGNDYVDRQGVVNADPVDPLGVAVVTNTAPASNAYGLAVRVISGGGGGGGGGAVFGNDANGIAPTAAPVLGAGWDGTLVRTFKTDTSGNQLMVISNGGNSTAVKAASTAALATDPSLVVAFSPNSALPTGANVIGAVTQSGTWTVSGAKASSSAGTITSAASVVGPFTVPTTGSVTVVFTGTYNGVNAGFWASSDNGVTYYPVQGTRSDTGIVEATTGVLTNTTRSWDFLVGGATHFKVITTAWVSGTTNVQFSPHAFAVDPSPAVIPQGASAVGATLLGNPVPMAGADASSLVRTIKTDVNGNTQVRVTDNTNFMPTMDAIARAGFQQITDGTNSASVKAASTAVAATDKALVVGISPNSLTGQTAAATSFPVALANEHILDQNIVGQSGQTASGNNIILAAAGTGATDCSQYRQATLQIITTAGIAGGVITFEQSNDATTWSVWPVYDANAPGGTSVTTLTLAASANRFFGGPIQCRYIRARISTVVSGGSVQAITCLRMSPHTLPVAGQTKVWDGSNTAKVAAASTAAVTTDPAVIVGISPNVANTPFALSAAGTTNATSVKASAGTVTTIVCSNTAAATNYLKFYNKASAPTVGTDVPILTIAIATNQTVALDLGMMGYRFSTGIALATTVNAVDSDTTVLAAANTMKIALSYN